MITTIFILSVMFLLLFVLDIPLILVATDYGSEREVFVTKLIAAFMISATIICLIVLWGMLIG